MADNSHIDVYLTDFSINFLPGDLEFGYMNFFPEKMVSKRSNKIYIAGKSYLTDPLDHLQPLADRTPAPEIAIGRSFKAYDLGRYAQSVFFHEDDLEDQDDPVDLEEEAIVGIKTRLMLKQEKVSYDRVVNAAVFTNRTATLTNGFNDYTNGTPVQDIRAQRVAILNRSGILPNAATMGFNVWNWLQGHPDVVSEFHTSGRRKRVTKEEFGEIFELDPDLVKVSTIPEPGLNRGIWQDTFALHSSAMTTSRNARPLSGVTPMKEGFERVFRNELGNPPETYELILQRKYQALDLEPDTAHIFIDTTS